MTLQNSDPKLRLKLSMVFDNKVLKYSINGQDYYFKYTGRKGDLYELTSVTRAANGTFIRSGQFTDRTPDIIYIGSPQSTFYSYLQYIGQISLIKVFSEDFIRTTGRILFQKR